MVVTSLTTTSTSSSTSSTSTSTSSNISVPIVLHPVVVNTSTTDIWVEVFGFQNQTIELFVWKNTTIPETIQLNVTNILIMSIASHLKLDNYTSYQFQTYVPLMGLWSERTWEYYLSQQAEADNPRDEEWKDWLPFIIIMLIIVVLMLIVGCVAIVQNYKDNNKNKVSPKPDVARYPNPMYGQTQPAVDSHPVSNAHYDIVWDTKPKPPARLAQNASYEYVNPVADRAVVNESYDWMSGVETNSIDFNARRDMIPGNTLLEDGGQKRMTLYSSVSSYSSEESCSGFPTP